MIATSNTYTPPARIWRALTFAHLLDAAGIASTSVETMTAAEWALLAAAVGVRPPSPDTCQLTISMLRNREALRRTLQPIIQKGTSYAINDTAPAQGERPAESPRETAPQQR